MEERTVNLGAEYLDEFLGYCRVHGAEHDESFTGADELSAFELDENISAIYLVDGCVQGVISLMARRDYRIRIFHCAQDSAAAYAGLWRQVRGSIPPGSLVEGFLPSAKAEILDIFLGLGFHVDRNIYVLEREAEPLGPVPTDPENGGASAAGLKIEVADFSREGDLADWAEIRNRAFAPLSGFRPRDPSFFRDLASESDHLADGALFLRLASKRIGIIRAVRDDQSGGTYGFIGPIAILPEYQGRGFGRRLLRTILEVIYGKSEVDEATGRHSPWKASLVVNADNPTALRLYTGEGFTITETVRALRVSV